MYGGLVKISVKRIFFLIGLNYDLCKVLMEFWILLWCVLFFVSLSVVIEMFIVYILEVFAYLRCSFFVSVMVKILDLVLRLSYGFDNRL